MRSDFGITQGRSLNKVYGTIIGGIASFVAIYLLPYPSLYLYIAIICIPVTFGLIRENYMYTSIFITITTIFIFAFITPNVYDLIYDRPSDTIIGAVLSFGANYLILPMREYNTYRQTVTKLVKANIGCLEQIKVIFNTEEGVTTAYKISRKEAVLTLSNLNTAFQRMLQEPKSVQNRNPSVYDIIVMQQFFLASVASFGIRLNSKRVTFPKPVFSKAIDNLIQLLQHTLALLIQQAPLPPSIDYKAPIDRLQTVVEKLSEQPTDTENLPISMRETQFCLERFNYLFGLARNLEQGVIPVSK